MGQYISDGLKLAFCVSLLIPGIAAADDFTATLGQPMKEVSHAVDLRLKDGVATYTVRRTFANGGKRHDEASLGIVLPYGAAATGLRIQSAKRWYRGELMERERAAELYQELTGMGPHAPKDPALLQWVWANEVHLQVFPVPPGGTATVEYTLTAPTRYVNGRHILSYPRPQADPALGLPVVRIHPQAPQNRIKVDGAPTARTQPVIIHRPAGHTWSEGWQPDSGASYVFSEIAVASVSRLVSAEVALNIRHTYKGDLKVELMTPWKRWHTLHDRKGGGDNDLRGRFKLPLKPGERGRPVKGVWRLVVSDHAGRDVGSVDSWSLKLAVDGKKTRRAVATDVPKFIPDAPEDDDARGCAVIEIDPPRINTVAARLGRVTAARDKHYLRLEVDAAPQLRPLPRKPSVVFVVDASHSIKKEGIKAQLDVARSFLQHVPDATFDLVLYRRRAIRLLSRFDPAPRFDELIKNAWDRKLLEPGNGSALDAGFLAAAKALRGRKGKRFIVMASDNLLRTAWKNKLSVRRHVRPTPGLVAHVVVPGMGEGEVTEERQDGHDLAPLAAAYGGVLLKIDGLPVKPENRKELTRVALGLVRPVRIDGFKVLGVGAEQLGDIPDVLNEGDGIREMALTKRAARQLRLTGKIWARRFNRWVTVTPRFSRATAAYVFSHDQHHELNRAEMMRVALLGRAVSPVTSYLAIEPGVRPSTAGIIRRGGGGGSGAGYGRGVGRLSGMRVRPPNLKLLLQDGVKRCVTTHKPKAGWSVRLAVETTLDEVVDVKLKDRVSPLGRCIVEAAWAVRLTEAYHRERQSFDVVLP